MNTNQVQQLVAAANANGFHLTGEQLTAIYGIAVIVAHWLWLMVEKSCALWVRIGGFEGFQQFIKTGTFQPMKDGEAMDIIRTAQRAAENFKSQTIPATPTTGNLIPDSHITPNNLKS